MLISNLRILVIDDQALVRKVVATLLASQGCNDVIEAANGVEARDIVGQIQTVADRLRHQYVAGGWIQLFARLAQRHLWPQ